MSVGTDRLLPTRRRCDSDGRQQFRLQMVRQVADLVQKQRSAPRAISNLADPIGAGVGKSAFDMTEQLASNSDSVSAPISTVTINSAAREERRCISRANTSFPALFSPVIRTLASVAATLSTSKRTCRIDCEAPQNIGAAEESSCRIPFRNLTSFSIFRRL